jgi:site-specific DNA-methyltransferase (adenine-specific)
MTATHPRGTATSRFGVGRRESHDASGFYARFRPPALSADDTVYGPVELDEPLRCGDARAMDLPDGSVALVVTSPPYFAGKEYEEAFGHGHVPATYLAYLDMLRDVFAECRRVLEPGGRMAVNVANLGRKPYRSLSGDVARILQDDLGLLLRGEVVWVKAEGAAGSCAWGSFRSAANPVLRDVTERVVIASKGRFDRARSPHQRAAEGLPHRSTMTNDEFMEATLDVWRMPPESARRVGHPAPFPVELPLRLIELYTYADDLVLDPFLGSGTTAVAAVRCGRRYAGYDTDPDYVALARTRLASERDDGRVPPAMTDKAVQAIAESVLEEAGFTVVHRNHRLRGLGVTTDVVARDHLGTDWYFDVSGAFTTTRRGLTRSDTLWKCLGRASVLAVNHVAPLVLLTTQLPGRRTAGDQALRAVGPRGFFDAIEMLADEGRDRLAHYAHAGTQTGPRVGFWTAADLGSVNGSAGPAQQWSSGAPTSVTR